MGRAIDKGNRGKMAGYFAGVDIGSRMTKVVIMKDDAVLTSVTGPTGPEHRKLASKVMKEAVDKAGLSFADIAYVVATGYGRINVPFADRQITEISCHARGVASLLPTARIVIDIGGQDCKAIKLGNGKPTDFVMNDKCAAGTGRFLEVMAEALGLRLEDMGELALAAKNKAEISNMCTVFAEREVVAKLADGVPLEDLVAGLHEALASRIYEMANRLKLEKDIAITGGGAKNIGLVRALESKLGYPVLIPPNPLITGAIGAALLGKDIAQQRTKIGLPLEGKVRHLQEATFFD